MATIARNEPSSTPDTPIPRPVSAASGPIAASTLSVQA